MRSFDFQIVIEKEIDDPGYLAYCPALQGCFSNGATVEGDGLTQISSCRTA